jgi:hypothetical protein
MAVVVNDQMESHMHNSIGAASELSPVTTSPANNGTIEVAEELTYEQLKIAHEFDRGMMSMAINDFAAIATLLVYHSNNNYDDPVGLIRDVEEVIEILINGWVF